MLELRSKYYRVNCRVCVSGNPVVDLYSHVTNIYPADRLLGGPEV